MVKSITARAESAWTLVNLASATRFTSLAGGDSRASTSTVANHQMRWPVAGVASRLGVTIQANARSTNTVISLDINNSAKTNSVTVPGGATGWFEDTSNTDAIAAGDLVCLRVVSGTGSGTLSANVAQIVFEATSGQKQMWGSAGPGAYNNTASVGYLGITGAGSGNLAQCQLRSPDAGTWSNLAVFIESNTLTLASVVYRSNINGSVGNQVVTVPAGATGWFEDTSNTDTVAAGDLLTMQKVGAGTGSGLATCNLLQSLWTPTNGRMLHGSCSALARTATAATTEYYNPHGNHPKASTQAPATSKVPYAAEGSGLRVRLISGTFTVAPAVFRLFKNGVAANQTITVPTGVNGTFEDTTNTDSFAAGDEVTIQLVNSGISGTVYISELAFNLYVQQNIDLAPPAGEIVFEGGQPRVGVILAPAGGDVVFEGGQPELTLAVNLAPAAGEIIFEGGTPEILMTRARSTQMGAIAIGEVEPNVRSTQLGEAVLAEVIPNVRATQLDAFVLAEVIPAVRTPQMGLIVIADAVECVTRWQQLWRIRRRDGVTHRFTSLDRPFTWGGEVYRSCRSLQPSASEDQTNIGGVGSQELRGIVDLDGVSQADLEGGLYDDAFADVWLVPWQGTESPRRIASGWIGKVTYDDDGFEMEVTGPGARLEQQALIQLFTPACRWVFGDPDTCKKDIEALKLAGEVLGSKSRDRFYGVLANDSSAGSGAESQSGIEWANGRVRWLTGRNAGQVTEVKEIDFTSGLVVLWALTGFVPQAGDAFEILPGCSKDPDACKGYGNYVNYGGFPDVPGEDAIQATPDAKY